MSKKSTIADRVSDIGEERFETTEHAEPIPLCSIDGRLVPKKGESIREARTNIDCTTREGKAMVFAGMSPADVDFDQNGQAFILATHWLVFADQTIDEKTGQVSHHSRTVLYDKDGNTFRTTADSAPHRIQAALDMFGPEVWAEGIPFRIRERVSKREKRTYHDIRIVWPDESEVLGE